MIHAIKSGLVLVVMLFSTSMFFAQKKDTLNMLDDKGRKQGHWIKKSNKGVLIYDGFFYDDVPVGIMKKYDLLGNLSTVLDYKKGGAIVYARLYYSDGKLNGEGKYINQSKDSLWKYYDVNEVLVREEVYKNGVKNGVERNYYSNGKLSHEINWSKGLEHGSWKEYYESGALKFEKNFVSGKESGPVTIYNVDSKVSITGKYLNGMRDGSWQYYNEDGTVKWQELYDKGKLIKTKKENGSFTEYYENNIPKEEAEYRGGIRHGTYKEYYNAGEWKKRPFADDKDGTAKGEEEQYLEGQKLKMKGKYVNGLLDGKLTYYSENGDVEKTEVYDKGKLLRAE